ncbi:MAG TPA: DUF481 domain-containing protein [Thermoanaerobaculia bacterium]|nr:DUF481 domain-containing protein [Thermoanaerobaculia bacterium]
MKRHRLLVLLASVLAALSPALTTHADRLTLVNGDRLTGAVVALADDELIFETPYAGTLTVDWAQVAALESDGPLTVVFADDVRLVAPAEAGDDGLLTLRSGGDPNAVDAVDAVVARPFAEVVAINPPEVPPWRWSGHLSAAITASSGNTEADRTYVEGEVVARNERNRFSLAGDVNEAEEDGETTASRRFARFGYDRFVSERWYLNGNLTATEDEFQDLALRATVGVAVGHQFADREGYSLSAELGASYVDEEFDTAPDDDYLAARWKLDLARALTDGVELFHDHEILQGVEDGDDRLIRTKTGVRFSLWKSFVAAVQVNWDRDESPAPGREKDDTVWALNLGYSW